MQATTRCWSASIAVSPPPPRSVRDLAAAFGSLVDQAFTATYPGHPRFEPADVEVTVRDLAAVYAHVERAVADSGGRVKLEGDIAAVRRVANALQVGMAGETHFLFGDDRFGPWGAEFERAPRLRFAATGVDPALTAAADDREIAIGLLVASPASGWPPAPGGVLTRDHALGAVAAAHLGLTDPVVDATSVLGWTADPAVLTRVADLRALAGDALTGTVLDWAAARAGTVGQTLRHLLRAGEARDAVPLGLVAGLLGEARDGAASEMAERAAHPAQQTPQAMQPEAMQLAREALLARADELLPPAGPPVLPTARTCCLRG